jgi:cell division septum initiation protein DivIVA
MTVEIMAMLDRLEDAIAQATKVPLTGKVLLDPDELLSLMDEMRELLPQEIRDANRVARDREAILTEARDQAESTVREAQALAARLTAEHSVAQEAQKQADELIDQAKRVAREIRQNALEWADELFGRVQPDLEKVAADTQKAVLAVRKAREELGQQL